MEGLINGIINAFGGITALKYGKELIVFIISLCPILELRGGLIAATLLGVKPLVGYIVSIIGNTLPVPFILLFITKVIDWMEKSKVKWMKRVAKWLRNKSHKNKEKIEKYGYLGLVLFVGIPLPGTGAWTGCLVASVFDMDRRKSFLAVMTGIIMASVIMMILSYGLLGGIIN